jgi:hypothetical protein
MTKIETHADALELLRALRWGVQKSRSILREAMGDDALAERLLTEQHPWLFGPRSILPKLAEYIGKAEAGAPIHGMELVNFVWIATESEPTIVISTGFANPRFLDLAVDHSWAARTWTAKSAAKSSPVRPKTGR